MILNYSTSSSNINQWRIQIDMLIPKVEKLVIAWAFEKKEC